MIKHACLSWLANEGRDLSKGLKQLQVAQDGGAKCSLHSLSPDLYLFILFYFIFFKFIYLFIYFGCVGSSFLCEGFLQLRRAGATLHRGARASHCHGLSHCGAQAPDAQAQ